MRETGLEHLTLLGVPPPELVTLAAAAGFRAWACASPRPPTTSCPGRSRPARPCWRRPCAAARTPGSACSTWRRSGWAGRHPITRPSLKPRPSSARGSSTRSATTPTSAGCATRSRRSPTRHGRTASAPWSSSWPTGSVRTLRDAVSIAAASPGGGILIDALHVQRCGVSLEALRALEPGLVGYVQLCDAPRQAPADQVREARSARLLPGEGELPLAELVAALPGGLPLAVEAPCAAAASGRREFASRPGRARSLSCRPRAGQQPASPGQQARARRDRRKGATPMPAQLAVRDLAKHYGGVQALRGVSLHVNAGEVLGVVGDNGAGKSTLLKILSGATFPSAGEVLLEGHRCGSPPGRGARRGDRGRLPGPRPRRPARRGGELLPRPGVGFPATGWPGGSAGSTPGPWRRTR